MATRCEKCGTLFGDVNLPSFEYEQGFNDALEKAARTVEQAEREKWESFADGNMKIVSLPKVAAAIRGLKG